MRIERLEDAFDAFLPIAGNGASGFVCAAANTDMAASQEQAEELAAAASGDTCNA